MNKLETGEWKWETGERRQEMKDSRRETEDRDGRWQTRDKRQRWEMVEFITVSFFDKKKYIDKRLFND